MADLRIVDAPEIPTENITGEEKLPTGGSGNYSISLDSLADYTKTKKDLADNTTVDSKVNGVRQELDAHIEDLLNPHQVTKGQIGLGNVDNTADADKPVSNSTQAAIISAVSPKADKTYVDNQLTLKANKVDVYTKQESGDLVNNSISTALTPINTSLDLAKRGVANRYDPLLTYNSGERVVLTNGDIIKSTIDGNTNNPNTSMTGWMSANTSANTSFSTFNRAISRVIEDHFLERVSIKDFGAIGDGTLHTLQEWVSLGKFSNLAAIQMVMPFVTSLNQSIDWAVTQHCVLNYANIYCPKGEYVLSNVVKTNHNTTPRNVGSTADGVRIFGDGVQTLFKRNDIRPATFELNIEETSTTQESDTANLNEACFSIHSPYTSITHLSFSDSAVGIFFGQDYSLPLNSMSDASSVAYSNINNLAFDRCGTAMLMLAAGGNHYVNFMNIHFTRCQIDLNQRASYWWKITQGRGDANNNRNTFINMRSDRSRIGFWTTCGDSNNLITWKAESMPSTANPFPMPDGLPVDVTDATALVFSGSNQLNVVSHSFAESVDNHVYNDGFQNAFPRNGFDENHVIMKQKPSEWRGRYVQISRGVSVADNSYQAFPEIYVAGAALLGYGTNDSTPLSNGVRVVTKDFWHQPKGNVRGSFERSFQIETGAIAANTPVAFTIWGNVDASTSGMVELDIVGRCDVTGQTSTYIVKALANVYKASTRVPSRYSIHRILASRTTSQGIGNTDEVNQISTTLQINPIVGQELQVVLSCPQALTSATIFVNQKAVK